LITAYGLYWPDPRCRLSRGIGHSPRQHHPAPTAECGDGHRPERAKRAHSRDKLRDDLTAAVDAFLSQPGMSLQTRRSYRLTLTALITALDAARRQADRSDD
jgi:hypothetical protein